MMSMQAAHCHILFVFGDKFDRLAQHAFEDKQDVLANCRASVYHWLALHLQTYCAFTRVVVHQEWKLEELVRVCPGRCPVQGNNKRGFEGKFQRNTGKREEVLQKKSGVNKGDTALLRSNYS
jgi:hypothetical protein